MVGQGDVGIRRTEYATLAGGVKIFVNYIDGWRSTRT